MKQSSACVVRTCGSVIWIWKKRRKETKRIQMVQTDKVFFSFFLRKLTVIPHNVCSGTVLSLSFFLLLSYTTHLSFFCCCYKCQGIWALDRRIVCTKEGNIFFVIVIDLPGTCLQKCLWVCSFFALFCLSFVRRTFH